MDDFSKKVKRSLDHTVFDNISYDRRESIHKVLKDSKPKGRLTSRFNMFNIFKKWIPSFLGIVVCVGLLIFTYQAIKLTPDKSPNQEQTVMPKKTAQSHNQQYSPVKDTGPLSKEELLFRMMNTVDYFSTAQGEFTYSHDGNKETINYGITMNGDNYNSFSKLTNKEYPKDNKIEYCNGKQITKIHPSEKEYETVKMAGNYKKGNPIKISEVVGTTGSGQGPTYYSRGRPDTLAFLSLFHWELVQSYLIANEKWEIVNQDNEMFGYKAVEVKGTIKRKLPNNRYITSFKLWINRPTGIILKWETYDNKGNIVDSLNTTSIKLNKKIDSDTFKVKIPSDYKQMQAFK